MTYVNAFIKTCTAFLKVKRRIVLQLHVGDSTPEGFDASHTFENGLHHIEIATEPSRGFLSVLAHEIVHAYMDEKHPRAPWHGFLFQRNAWLLEQHLKSKGYAVEKIFMLGVDK